MALNLDSIGKKIGPVTKEYSWRDVVLYALGVGAGFDDLEYCYEDQLKVIPSFSIGAVFDFLAEAALTSEANLAGVLHGEQEILFHRPIPKQGTLTTEGAITHIYDKGEGKGALVVAQADTFHSNGEKLYSNIFTLFSRLDGGFGGQASPPEEFSFPDRAPDFELADQPSADQPLLYRLSGDVFALHVNPDFASASGFEKPIMHGLCTFGFATRALVGQLFPGEPERMTRIKVRFSKTLYPGTPIKTQIWKTDDGQAVFRVIDQANEQVVIDRGQVEWMDSETAERRAKTGGIRLDDRVAIVTGAGGGLGREYALELARRGAKVVVNDLGGAADGQGAGQAPADQVVKEIQAAGGEAVANYDSVATPEGGQAIVQTALSTWGRLDVLVNNAGILKDKTFVKMSLADWEAVLAVHLEAAYNVTRPALAPMREGGFGRIVMTTSAAGLFGNFGQANYSAAKLALVGFMNTLKAECGKYNILVNTVAPIAKTRLTEDILPPDLADQLEPEFVAPLVVYLATEQCQVNGQIFNAGGGYFSRAAILTGPGAVVGEVGQVPSAEQVAEAMQAISSLKGATLFDDATACLGAMLQAFEGDAGTPDVPANSGPSPAQVFEKMPDAFQPDRAAGVDVVFQYELSGDGGGKWHAIIKDQTCEVKSGAHASPTTTILMDAGDFLSMIQGKLKAMAAYTSGKLKIQGDLMKSQLIEKIFKF